MLAITFVLSLIAILIGILAYRRGRALNRRLDEMNRSFFPNMVRQKDAIERIDKRIQGIAIELKRRFGELTCNAETRLGQAFEMDLAMRHFLTSYLSAGASDSALEPTQTLAQFSQANNVSIDTLLNEINLYLEDPGAFRAAQQQHASLIQIDALKRLADEAGDAA